MGKSYFSPHEKCLARAAVQAGLRPVPTLWLDQPPLGMSKKTDCLKRRASDAPPLFFWRSDSLEHGLNISEAAPSNVRAGPLDSRLENQPFMGLRLCQSRNGATNSTIAEESFPGDVTRATEGARAEHVTPETKNSRGKRNQLRACFKPIQASTNWIPNPD